MNYLKSRKVVVAFAAISSIFLACNVSAAVENVAKGKEASSSGNENNIFLPKLAVDGVINRNNENRQQSRWCSNVLPENQFKNGIWEAPSLENAVWFQVDLGEVTNNLQEILIEWEFAKVINYTIQISNDNKTWTEAYRSTKKSLTNTELISLDKSISARYIKLVINKFERQQWPAVSIYEFKVFNGKMPETLQMRTNRLTANDVVIKDGKIVLDVKDDYKIVGSNFKQLIDLEGNVYLPISDKDVLVTFELQRNNEKAETAAIPVKLKGTKTVVSGTNVKPLVIPSLQEWYGTVANFQIPEELKLVIKSQGNTDELTSRMSVFMEDYAAQTNKKIKLVKRVKANDKIITVNLVTDGSFKLGKEGYILNVTEKGLEVEASDPIGAFWATRTILQLLKGNNNEIPCGITRDYPQYPVRGFMLDIGRKPITIEMIKDVMKTMSWYKMNDFQVHLNDCYIWLHEYTKVPNDRNASDENKAKAIEDVMRAAPAAFRLESKTVGKNGATLTAKDRFYTKEQFGRLIDEGRKYGVNIVPEIDVPGHALSFVNVRPDLMYRGKITSVYDVERSAMLDVSENIYDAKTGKTFRQETLEFIESVFDEYLLKQGKNPAVFRNGVVHIGTDEYYGDAEDYRAFADHMLKYVKSKGFTPRLWGSLTKKPGKTPVYSEGVQMHVWSLGWQNPQPAIDLGFDIINIQDGYSYIVPNGKGNVGGYGDYLNLKHIYSQNWHPNIFGGQRVIAGHPKLLGAQWALWNDNTFCRDTGLVDYDLYDRIQHSCSVYAEKTWSTGEDKSYEDFMKLYTKLELPATINPRFLISSKTPTVLSMEFENKKLRDSSGNNYHASKSKNIRIDKNGKVGKALLLKGGNSHVKSGIKNLAPNYEVEFWAKRLSNDNNEQIIFGSHTGSFKAVQKDTGKVGITRDTWDYSFDYTMPVGEWVKIKLVAEDRNVVLFVDDKEIGKPIRNKFPETHKFSTFILPLENIGDENQSFHGLIDELKVIKK